MLYTLEILQDFETSKNLRNLVIQTITHLASKYENQKNSDRLRRQRKKGYNVLAQRNPVSKSPAPGKLPARSAQRAPLRVPFQEPPRSTLNFWEVPYQVDVHSQTLPDMS